MEGVLILSAPEMPALSVLLGVEEPTITAARQVDSQVEMGSMLASVSATTSWAISNTATALASISGWQSPRSAVEPELTECKAGARTVQVNLGTARVLMVNAFP
jgi:hypothetical protein